MLLMDMVVSIINQIAIDNSVSVAQLCARDGYQLFLKDTELLFGQGVRCLLFFIVSPFDDIVQVCPVPHL